MSIISTATATVVKAEVAVVESKVMAFVKAHLATVIGVAAGFVAGKLL